MIRKIRDDIIKLESYVKCEFEYADYLFAIYDCGGYIFLDQFDRLFTLNYDSDLDEKKVDSRYLIKKIEEEGLVKSEYFSNYKYIYLTQKALKYIKYKMIVDEKLNKELDNPGFSMDSLTRVYSEINPDKIYITPLNKHPSEKTLLSSVMFYELLMRPSFSYLDNAFSKSNHIRILNAALKLNNIEEIQDLKSKKINYENELLDHIRRLDVITSVFNDTVSAFNLLVDIINNKLLEEYFEDKKNKENEKVFKNNTVLKNLDVYISAIENIKNESSIAINNLYKVDKSRQLEEVEINKCKRDINLIENEIIKLKNEEQLYNEKVDSVIKKLIEMRDISKIICIFLPDREGGQNTLHFKSTFLVEPKPNYDTIINNTIYMLRNELNIEITEVQLDLHSVKDSKERIDPIFKELSSKVHQYAYIKNTKVKRNYIFNYEILDELQKYFSRVTNNINYIDNTEIFEILGKKLSMN